jgi:methyl-accepting chemotaxis protein
MQHEIPPYIYIIFTAVTSVGVLLQAFVLLGIYLGIRKTTKKLEDLADEGSVHLLPTIATSRKIVEDLAPKIKTISANLVETSQALREEAAQVRIAVDDVVGRTRGQAAKVDELITGTLNGVAHATATLQEGLAMPLRQVHGVLNGIRAALDVLRQKNRATHVAEDEDLFV